MNRAEAIRTADKLWGKICAWTFNQRCALCGATGCDPHHWFYKRSNLKYRWEVNNGVYLCRICHNEVTTVEGREKLHALIKDKYADTYWKWAMSCPPYRPEPIKTSWIIQQITKFQLLAKILKMEM